MKNHLPRLIIMILLLVWLDARMAMGNPVELWAAPDGSDKHPGTSNLPLASLSMALHKWSALRQGSAPVDLRVVMRGGWYPVSQSLLIKAQDGPSRHGALTIQAAPGEKPVLSGGVAINHWERPSRDIRGLPAIARDKIWMADAPRRQGHVVPFRELWLNGVKATLAREPNGDHLAHLVAWDKTHQVATIPATTLLGLQKPDHMEMVVDQVWEIAILRVKSAQMMGTNVLLTFRQPESNLEFEHPWPPVTVTAKYQAPFYLANAVQFLDSPGEWFEDSSAGKIYYWPRSGEDMTQARAVAPCLETLLQVEGTLAMPLSHLTFRGITFANTTWSRPSLQGHVPLQAGMFMLKVKKLSPRGTSYHPGLDNLAWIGRPPAAVCVQNADHVLFDDCTFEHLGSAGLDLASGVRESQVKGCQFRDIGGNGLQMGKFSDPDVETHVPYDPPDGFALCTADTIANNVVTDCGTEDWGCVGIAAGYVRHLTIAHNEVNHLPYTGISLGWGWTKMTNGMRDNAIIANHIQHVGCRLGDLGGIYTLSAQPGTVVAGNVIADIAPSAYVPDPKHWFYLYADEGSSGITWRDNWCPTAKFLKNANGPGNVWLNNGPGVSEQIKDAAGLEPGFRYLLK